MNYIRGFDGLRAISILLVLCSHLGLYSLIEGHAFLRENFDLYNGNTGVMIFFTISGFLITSLLLKEKKANGRINFKYFFIRRFLRLLPPLFIFFIIMLSLMLAGFLPANYPALLIAFFYLYNFVPFQFYTDELAHTWSLGVEEQFYLIWPFVISALRKVNRGIYFAAGIILLCVLGEVLLPQTYFVFGHKVNFAAVSYVERWFIPACLPIMIGSLSAILLFSYREPFEKAFHKNYWVILLSLALFFAQLYIPGLPQLLIHLFKPAGIALFLLWVYCNQQHLLVSILETEPLAYIGRISYGLYIYQGLYLRNAPGGSLWIQQFPQNILLVFATASLSYFLVEQRVKKYKNRFFSVDKG